jgi:hypothetical protein
MDNLSMGELIGDCTPLKNKALAGSKIQIELMKKNETVGQDNPDGYKRERRNGVVVFDRKKQNGIPLVMIATPYIIKI